MARYHHPAIRQLAEQQVRYAPFEVRRQQMRRAEEFLARIEPEDRYSYQTICEEITSFRSDRFPDVKLTGKQVNHDVRCFVEDVSDSMELRPENFDEPVWTVEDVSSRFNVSTKTVDRWRDRGLASRRIRFGSRKRVGFLESSVRRFVETHPEEVSRGSRFSQLSDEERRNILRRARRLAQHGAGLSEVSRRLSQRFNRSPETVRYTLRAYDEQHPENAIFAGVSRPLTEDERRAVLQAFTKGASVETLSRQYRRSRASVYRIVAEQRAKRLMELEISFMDSDDFRREDADQFILEADPPEGNKPSRVKLPPGLPPYLASLYTVPLLNRELEVYHFRKMNYLKYKASKVLEDLDSRRPSTAQLEQIEDLLERAQQVKNLLIRSNLRLVVSIAKRHVKPYSNFFEMVSDGNMSLIRAIEKFDYTKGNKFSTYASWAIMKNYARSVPAEHTQLDRFRTGNDELFQASTDEKSNPFQLERENRVQQRMISRILDQLDDRERRIIVSRYGLEPNTEPQTLEQVGTLLGVTKERIRQLEARALRKLRQIADDQKLDIPGL